VVALQRCDIDLSAGASGRTLWRGNFNKLVKWPRSVRPGCTSTTCGTPATPWPRGHRAASLRDIMARMGHDSPRAALIYQHTNQEADHGIADAIDRAVRAARRKPSKRTPKRGI
jgi:hypothetical protein